MQRTRLARVGGVHGQPRAARAFSCLAGRSIFLVDLDQNSLLDHVREPIGYPPASYWGLLRPVGFVSDAPSQRTVPTVFNHRHIGLCRPFKAAARVRIPLGIQDQNRSDKANAPRHCRRHQVQHELRSGRGAGPRHTTPTSSPARSLRDPFMASFGPVPQPPVDRSGPSGTAPIWDPFPVATSPNAGCSGRARCAHSAQLRPNCYKSCRYRIATPASDTNLDFRGHVAKYGLAPLRTLINLTKDAPPDCLSIVGRTRESDRSRQEQG